MAPEAPVGAVGAVPASGLDPNAAGGGVIDPNAASTSLPDSGAVQPQDQAPADGTPAEVPEGETDEQLIARETAKLTPEQRTEFTRVLTKMRQKDGEKVRSIQEEAQQLGWARDLQGLLASPDPTQRGQGIAILDTVLRMAKGQAPDQPREPEAPQIDWQTADAIVPGLGAYIQAQEQKIARLEGRVGQVSQTAEGVAQTAASQRLDTELADVAKEFKGYGIDLNGDEVLQMEDRLGIADLRSAAFALYGPKLAEAGKQSAYKALQTKKEQVLPGGTVAAGAETRPKMRSMQEHIEFAKRQLGITGTVEYTG